jgi:hypothetical protein
MFERIYGWPSNGYPYNRDNNILNSSRKSAFRIYYNNLIYIHIIIIYYIICIRCVRTLLHAALLLWRWHFARQIYDRVLLYILYREATLCWLPLPAAPYYSAHVHGIVRPTVVKHSPPKRRVSSTSKPSSAAAAAAAAVLLSIIYMWRVSIPIYIYI